MQGNHAAPGQFAQYKKLGVIASVQPSHLLTDMHWAIERIGADRAKTSYPWKLFLDDGIPLAFGTDYPVEPITPFRGIYAAVTRKNEAGTKEYFPEQKLTIEQAIAAYTDFTVVFPDDKRVAAAQSALVKLKAEQVRGSFEIAQFYEHGHKWAGAIIYYNDVLQLDANSPLAAQARQRIEILKPRLPNAPQK